VVCSDKRRPLLVSNRVNNGFVPLGRSFAFLKSRIFGLRTVRPCASTGVPPWQMSFPRDALLRMRVPSRLTGVACPGVARKLGVEFSTS